MTNTNDRFTTQAAGRYTLEFDHELQELRLSWSGAQTFLSLEECYSALDLLGAVLPARPFEIDQAQTFLDNAHAQLKLQQEWLAEFRARLYPGQLPENEATR